MWTEIGVESVVTFWQCQVFELYIIESEYIEYQKFLFRYLTIKKNTHRISSDPPLQSLLSPSDVFPSPSSLPVHWRGVDPYERQKLDFLKGFT